MSKTYMRSLSADKGDGARVHAKRLRQEQMAAWVGVPEPGTKLIPLLKNQFAKVDDDMYEYLKQWNWHGSAFGYAVRFVARRVIWMHKLVCPCQPGYEVDHINRDRLDNRRKNLRPATKVQNQGNRWKSKQAKSSKYKGVCRVSHTQKFVACGTERNHVLNLGLFNSEIDAARAYNEWAKSYFGEFALLNPV